MGLQLAIGKNGDLSLWCDDRGFTPTGGQRFWVINGHWEGIYQHGKVYICDHEDEMDRARRYPGKLIWRGHTPFRDEDYNEAMAWLRTYLKRQPNLRPFFERMEHSMAKINFGDAITTIDTERHNERVTALATAHADVTTAIKRQEAKLEKMRAYQTELVAKGEAVEDLSDEEFSALFNRHFDIR